jgi:hypothetical protein
MKLLRPIFLLVDLGFIAYWTVTVLHLIPQAWLFQDYTNPLLVAWNWSFLPLDLAVSVTGLLALRLHVRGDPRYRPLALTSLCLTTASGFQAISFWAARCEFDPLWWIPNLFLLIYPWYFIVTMFLCLKPDEGTRGKPV